MTEPSVDAQALRLLLINAHVSHATYGEGIILDDAWSDDGNPHVAWFDREPMFDTNYPPLRQLAILGVFTEAEADRRKNPPRPLDPAIIKAMERVAWREPPEDQQVVMLNDACYVAQHFRDEATKEGERRIAAAEKDAAASDGFITDQENIIAEMARRLDRALDAKTIVDDHQVCEMESVMLKAIIADGIEAFRLTREYAGSGLLPPSKDGRGLIGASKRRKRSADGVPTVSIEIRFATFQTPTLLTAGFFSIKFPKATELADFYDDQPGRLLVFGIDDRIDLLADSVHDFAFYTFTKRDDGGLSYLCWHATSLELGEAEAQEDGSIAMDCIARSGPDSLGLTWSEVGGMPSVDVAAGAAQ